MVFAGREAVAGRGTYDRDDPHCRQKKLDGKEVECMEHVTDEQYQNSVLGRNRTDQLAGSTIPVPCSRQPKSTF